MYDSSCDGVWLMQKVLKDNIAWDTGGDYSYAQSSINTWLNSTYLNYLGNAKAIIKNVKIPYAYGSQNGSIASGVNGLSCKIFLLSNREVGNTYTTSYYANDGKKLAYFDASGPQQNPKRIAYTAAGTANSWWLRSAYVGESTHYGPICDSVGQVSFGYSNYTAYARPCFIIPNNTQIDSDNNIIVPGQLTVDALSIGDSVFANVNGARTEFLIVHNGNPDSSIYDSSCDGVWCLMKDCYMNYAWSNEYNKYAESNVNTWLNNTFIGFLDSNIQNLIKQIKIPYCVGYWSSTVNSGVNGLSCKSFLVSAYELGLVLSDYSNLLPADGAKLDYFDSGTGTSAQNKRIAKLYNSANSWWLRSPITNDRTSVGNIGSTGVIGGASANNQYAVRPAFILPHTAKIDSNNNIVG